MVRAWLRRYATDQHRLVDPDLPDELIRSDLQASLVAAVIFLASTPIAPINPYLAEFSRIYGKGSQNPDPEIQILSTPLVRNEKRPVCGPFSF